MLEFFWYACPHCYAIDPLVESLEEDQARLRHLFPRACDVERRAIVPWRGCIYTLDSLGKLDQLHGEIFKEIHVNGNPLVAADPNNAAETERIQTAFVKKARHFGARFQEGLSLHAVRNRPAEGGSSWCSAIGSTACRRSSSTASTSPMCARAGSPERLISLVGDLAAQEHKR